MRHRLDLLSAHLNFVAHRINRKPATGDDLYAINVDFFQNSLAGSVRTT